VPVLFKLTLRKVVANTKQILSNPSDLLPIVKKNVSGSYCFQNILNGVYYGFSQSRQANNNATTISFLENLSFFTIIN